MMSLRGAESAAVLVNEKMHSQKSSSVNEFFEVVAPVTVVPAAGVRSDEATAPVVVTNEQT